MQRIYDKRNKNSRRTSSPNKLAQKVYLKVLINRMPYKYHSVRIIRSAICSFNKLFIVLRFRGNFFFILLPILWDVLIQILLMTCEIHKNRSTIWVDLSGTDFLVCHEYRGVRGRHYTHAKSYWAESTNMDERLVISKQP